MCIKLPDLLDDAKHISDEEKSKILFKIGDLLRFLNRHHDLYFLQRFRKATVEEVAKAQRLKKKLGLEEEIKEDEVTTEASGVEETIDLGFESKKKRKQPRKKNKQETPCKRSRLQAHCMRWPELPNLSTYLRKHALQRKRKC